MVIKCLDAEAYYHFVITDAVGFIEKRFPICICFGGIIGSTGYELHNETSDTDVILFYETTGNIDDSARQTLNKSVPFRDNIDLIMIDVTLLDYAHLPDGQIEAGIFPNHIKPHFNFDYNVLPGETNCKLRCIITETLFCRKLWDDRRYLSSSMASLEKHLTVYDYMKRQYVYAQGRLNKYLVGGEVRLRSYLYTARDILAIGYILEKEEFPPLSFMRLLDECDDPKAKAVFQEMYLKNSRTNDAKEKLVLQPIITLNKYFTKKLEELRPLVEEYYRTRRYHLFKIDLSD